MTCIRYAKDLPIDPKAPNSCLYWIYNSKLHTNPSLEGYIGVSAQSVKNRFDRHKKSAENGSELVVHRAMRKYGRDIHVKILILTNSEFCLLAEEMLRPEKYMGWNIKRGGGTKISRVKRGRKKS